MSSRRRFLAIAAGGEHSAAIAEDGHALTWGEGIARADMQTDDGYATVWGHTFRTDIRMGQDPEFAPFILFLFR